MTQVVFLFHQMVTLRNLMFNDLGDSNQPVISCHFMQLTKRYNHLIVHFALTQNFPKN